MSFEAKRLGVGDALMAGGALILVLVLVFVDWFRITFEGISGTDTGWNILTTLRWLMLATIVLAVAVPLLRASGRRLGLPFRPGLAVAAVAATTTVLVGYRLLFDRPEPGNASTDLRIGAWLGLLSLVAITAGAVLSLRDGGREQT